MKALTVAAYTLAFLWAFCAMGLPVAGRITPELLLAACAMKGEHHARQN